jgi:hypothetical protein
MTFNPTNPVLIEEDTSAPRFIAAATGVIFVPGTTEGAGERAVSAGDVIDALLPVLEGGVSTGELLSSAAAQDFPLGTATDGGPARFVESPILGDQIGEVEASEPLGKGTTPVVPDVTVPNAYDFPGTVIGTDAQNPVTTASSALESTIPNTPATRANLTAGQNAPIAGTGGTPRNLGVTMVLSEAGARPAIL